MHLNQLKDSKFLKKEDCGQGILATIKTLSQESVNKDGAPEELKYALWFEELEKPLILNGVNSQIIATICKSEETDDWTGHKIVLYNDPTVSFGGRLTGGIRVRAPKNQAPKPAPAPARAPVKAAPPRTSRQAPQPEPEVPADYVGGEPDETETPF